MGGGMNNFVVIAVACVILFIAGCGHKTQVILMPDSDGHVGQIEVVTDGGSRLLSEAGQMTVVSDRSRPPSEISVLDQTTVENMFSEALAVEPLPPEKFILYFLPGSDKLTPGSLKLIPQVISSIRERKSLDISIYGHADRVGSEAYNLTLSVQRTLAVQAVLANEGVNPDNMETASHGEGNPLINTSDGVAESRNRRVEVIVR